MPKPEKAKRELNSAIRKSKLRQVFRLWFSWCRGLWRPAGQEPNLFTISPRRGISDEVQNNGRHFTHAGLKIAFVRLN